ncbi:MAG: glycosyltransferase family 2 protein [Kiritimatiellia bacterium]
MSKNDVIIVIPCTSWNPMVLECLIHCDKLDGGPYEAWVLPDSQPGREWQKKINDLNLSLPFHIEPTGPGNPSRKRNVALRKSEAEIFALIDSDAYPQPDWLDKALKILNSDSNIGAVAGPNLTPPEDSLSRRVSGRVMESPLGFGKGWIRHVPSTRQTVNEMPTCNMIIRREGVLFREDLDTGEDMTYCAEIRAKGKSIVYVPDVVVYHHRRKAPFPFMKQFYEYGLFKGRLARARSGITYLWQAFPSLFLIYLTAEVILFFTPVPVPIKILSLLPLALYAACALIETVKTVKSSGELLIVPLLFPAAHIAYGWGYMRGIVSKQ